MFLSPQRKKPQHLPQLLCAIRKTETAKVKKHKKFDKINVYAIKKILK